jgi:hypothetical protein
MPTKLISLIVASWRVKETERMVAIRTELTKVRTPGKLLVYVVTVGPLLSFWCSICSCSPAE